MACLETDFLIALIRKDKDALKKLRQLVEKGEKITTTPINASELFKGACLSERVDENLRAVKGILSRSELLEFNITGAEYYGKIYSELKERGALIGDMDILIAGIAFSSNEKLITRNVKHYSRIRGLKVESW
ncbi:MAG: type II toxin-antitoxin system VapC family toxin [Methanophagales archaeon]|jgi:predicted nucleic acid-binding protein|nr:type II toxin-antitoxin system VapC family toxin [Methanophagales archaeon]